MEIPGTAKVVLCGENVPSINLNQHVSMAGGSRASCQARGVPILRSFHQEREGYYV